MNDFTEGSVRRLAVALWQYQMISFGDFVLKSGMASPVYVDVRKMIGYPALLSETVALFAAQTCNLSLDLVCGVPYAAIPLATLYAYRRQLPQILLRKEVKGYGAKRRIEGAYQAGQTVLLIEDTLTTGQSLYQAIQILEDNGLKVAQVLVVVDRAQGGKAYLEDKGYEVRALLNLKELLTLYRKEAWITAAAERRVRTFLETASLSFRKPAVLSYEEKSVLNKNPIARRLLQLALKKKSNLMVALDGGDMARILALLEALAPYIVALKLHIDSIAPVTDVQIQKLRDSANRYEVLIFEDRKIADIGHIQCRQLQEGPYQIVNWADMVSVHLISGGESFSALLAATNREKIGFVPVVEMSAKGHLMDAAYQQRALEIVTQYEEAVAGVVGQEIVVPAPLLKFTPGIHLNARSDQKGQQYIDIQTAIQTRGADFIIVGRAVIQAEQPAVQAQLYRHQGWQAYLERCGANK